MDVLIFFLCTTPFFCLCLHHCSKLSMYFDLSLSFTFCPQCSKGSLFFALCVSLVLWRQCAGTYFSLSLSLSLLSHSRSLFLSPMHFSISVSKQSNFRTCNVSLSKFFCNKKLKTLVPRQICQNLVKIFC